jgi:hypothetical protein
VVTSVIAIIAGVAGAFTGIGAFINTRRDLQTKADANYVDRNLAAMQAVVDFQTAENQRLRAELDECNRRCEECLTRVRNLERNV